MRKPKRKFSRFPIAEPDCKGSIGDFTVRVFLNEKYGVRTEYAQYGTPSEIKTAVNTWIKYDKYGGMSLDEYLNSLFIADDYRLEYMDRIRYRSQDEARRKVLEEILGKSFKEANAYAKKMAFRIRKSKVDGKAIVCTRDYRLDRINIELENDIVVKAKYG